MDEQIMQPKGIRKNEDYCTFCPKMCHFACPIADLKRSETLSPWGKQQVARMVDAGQMPLSREAAALAYECLTCGRSQSACDHQISDSESLLALRAQSVRKRLAPEMALHFSEKFRLHSNPYAENLQQKIKSLIPTISKSGTGSTLFFASCHSLALQPESLPLYWELFQKLKIPDIGIYSEALQCCGQALQVLGHEEEFEKNARLQFKQLKQVKTLVVGSPECAWAFRELYPKYGFQLKTKILTLPEFLAPYLSKLNLKCGDKTREYYYHDACYLGRHLGQYDAPRDLLTKVLGFSPLELRCSRQESLCSGAGGGYSLIDPQSSNALAQLTLGNLREKKAVLITACPQAAEKFKQNAGSLIVKDWCSFIAEAIQIHGL